MSDNIKKPTIKMLDLLVETAQFLTLGYLLGSALISFRRHILFVLIFAAKTALISKYWSQLNRIADKQMVRIGIFTFALLVLLLLFMLVGYLPIGTAPNRL